jgi:hypothetical protein
MRVPKKTRKVTAYNACTTNRPEIRIVGRYLTQMCGWTIGETVAVTYGPGEITIRTVKPAGTVHDTADKRELLTA